MATRDKVIANLVRHIGELHLENAHLDAMHIEAKERADTLASKLEGLETKCAMLRLNLELRQQGKASV